MLDFGGSWDEHLPLAEFAYNNSYHSSIGMAPFEALYGRLCRSSVCWMDFGEAVLLGPDIVQQTTDKVNVIRQRLQTARSRQKSYADRRRRPLVFETGNHVFLRVSPRKGVIRFGKGGKLSPTFVGPFEILDKIGEVAYRLALPPQLANVHLVFHVSMLRKYNPDPTHILRVEDLTVDKDLSFETCPVNIVMMQEKVLRNKVIPLVRVLWRRQGMEEETWEREDEMRERHPELFA